MPGRVRIKSADSAKVAVARNDTQLSMKQRAQSRNDAHFLRAYKYHSPKASVSLFSAARRRDVVTRGQSPEVERARADSHSVINARTDVRTHTSVL